MRGIARGKTGVGGRLWTAFVHDNGKFRLPVLTFVRYHVEFDR